MAHDLVVVAVLVSEHAAGAIHALLLLVEDTTVFSSLLVFFLCCAEDLEFLFPVRKLALSSISAGVSFDPVLAHLGLILVFRDFLDTLVILGSGKRLFRGISRACGRSEAGFEDHLEWRGVDCWNELLSRINSEWIAAQLSLKWVCCGAHLLLWCVGAILCNCPAADLCLGGVLHVHCWYECGVHGDL